MSHASGIAVEKRRVDITIKYGGRWKMLKHRAAWSVMEDRNDAITKGAPENHAQDPGRQMTTNCPSSRQRILSQSYWPARQTYKTDNAKLI